MSLKAVRRNTLPTVWKAVSTEFPTKPYTNLTSRGARGVQATKQNIVKAKDGIQKFKEKRAAQSLQKQAQAAAPRKGVGQGIKAVEQPKKAVKESARSAGKRRLRRLERLGENSAENGKNRRAHR